MVPDFQEGNKGLVRVLIDRCTELRSAHKEWEVICTYLGTP